MNPTLIREETQKNALGLHVLQGLVKQQLSDSLKSHAEFLDWRKTYAFTLGVQAYIFGFPWIYLSQLRWLWCTPAGQKLAEDQGLQLPQASINHFFHGNHLSTPKEQTGGAPNCDTLYSVAWLDLSREPIVLSVPEVTNRYYCMQLACMDSDNFDYVGVRKTGTEAGHYLIAGPGWTGSVPQGVQDILNRSRTPAVLIFGRTGVNNKSLKELRNARDIQKQYQLCPLSRFPEPGPGREHPTHALIPIGLENEDPNNPLGTWLSMNRAMTENPPGVPPGIDQAQLLQLFATIGVGPGQDLLRQSQATLEGLKLAALEGIELLQKMSMGRGKQINGWSYPPMDIGRAGQNGDFITRAAVQALAGIAAHDPEEAVYINTNVDKQGRGLNGAMNSKYKLSFNNKMNFPPFDEDLHGFWSVTMYDSTYNLVQGSEHYSINSYDSEFQKRDSRGGMTIHIQNQDPGSLKRGHYWLQSPRSKFFLILRVYIPGPTITPNQTWKPPPIERQSGS